MVRLFLLFVTSTLLATPAPKIENKFYRCTFYSAVDKDIYSRAYLRDGDKEVTLITGYGVVVGLAGVTQKVEMKIVNREVTIKTPPSSEEVKATIHGTSGELLSEHYETKFDCERVELGWVLKTTNGEYFQEFGEKGFQYYMALSHPTTLACYFGNAEAATKSLQENTHHFFYSIATHGYELTVKAEPVVADCLAPKAGDLSKCLNDKKARGLVSYSTRVTRVRLDGKKIVAETSTKPCLDFVSVRDGDSSCTEWGEWKAVPNISISPCL